MGGIMTEQLEKHRTRFNENPEAVGSFDVLVEHFFYSHEWEALAACYRHRLTAPSLASQTATRAQLRFQLAQLLEEHLADDDGAIHEYRECVSSDPSLTLAWQRLRNLYTARGSWSAVLQVIELEVGQTPSSDERARLFEEMARIWCDEIGDAEQSDVYRKQALELSATAPTPEPEAPPAPTSTNEPAVLHDTSGADPSPPSSTTKAIAETQSEDIAEFVSDEELERIADSQSAAEVRDAESSDNLTKVNVSESPEKLVAISVSDENEGFCNVSTSNERADEIQIAQDRVTRTDAAGAETLEPSRRTPVSGDGGDTDDEARGECAESQVQHAWLLAARGDSDAAVASLRDTLEARPDDTEAIDMLITVLEGSERYSELSELLERRADLAADIETRVAVLNRLGSVCELQLGDASSARTAFERALSAAPENASAHSGLIRMYRAGEHWSKLRALFETSTQSGPNALRAERLCDLAELLHDQFDEPDRAMEAYDQALSLDPQLQRAVQAVEQLRINAQARKNVLETQDGTDTAQTTGSENRSVRVVGVLERKLARIQDEGRDFTAEAIKLRMRIAEIRSTTLGDLESAIEMLTPCLQDDDAMLDIAQRLSSLYERAGQHDALIALAQRAAQSAQDPEERAGWYRRAAETACSIGNSEIAISFYQCLLTESEGDRNAEAALIGLHRERGETQQLVDLLRIELARVGSREEIALQLELAELFEGPLSDPNQALPHWRRALTLDSTQAETLDRALLCAANCGGTPSQLDLINHLAHEASDEPARARILARRGDLMVDEFGWLEEGAESWRDALEIDPNQPETRSRLTNVEPRLMTSAV